MRVVARSLISSLLCACAVSAFGCATAVDESTSNLSGHERDALVDSPVDAPVDHSSGDVANDVAIDSSDSGTDSSGGDSSVADVAEDTVSDTSTDTAQDTTQDTLPDNDPCQGVTCDHAPASYCSDAEHLHVSEAPGTCSNGTCSYSFHEEFCAFGCDQGACKDDPCKNVTCDKPPASHCSDAQHLRVYSTPGQCKDGSCSYDYTDQACQFGCNQTVCNQCSGDTDCGAGKWCDNHTCKPCTTSERCGSTCTDCTTSNQVCSSDGSSCVECVTDVDCGSGKWCNASTCGECNSDAHCGATCQACGGTTPHCQDGSCECTAGSCGSNQQCVSGACQVCATDSACGASCQACGSATPRCLASGNTSTCVECLDKADCPSGFSCQSSTHKCVDCRPPTDACSNGKQNMDGCSNAKIIGRPQAAAGYKDSDDLCYSANRFDESGGCYDGGDDNAYRIYLREGEKIHIEAKTGFGCGNGFWWGNNLYLAVYGAAAGSCGDKSCASRLWCDTDGSEIKHDFIAPSDGWFVIVVGSDSYAWNEDDEGDYDLKVNLTCNVAGCEC